MKVLKEKLKGRKLNNRGFSLVELLVAMAILGVVSLTIYSFMMTGSRFYQRSSADADIQSEAQLVANTISDLIIDCEVNISYDDQISNSINSEAGSIQAQGRTLEISNTDYQFLIFHDGNRLFYLERRPDPANPTIYEAYNINKAELLAENITAFDVDLSRVSGKDRGKNIVTFTMTYEEGGRSYSGNYQVNLRNAVTVSANSITPQTKEPNMTRIDVSPRPITVDVKGKEHPVLWVDGLSSYNSVTGQPNLLDDDQRERKFTANSDAVNVGRDDLYTWTLEGDHGTASIAAGNSEREMTIRFEEDMSNVPLTGGSFKVKATATIPNVATGGYAEGEALVYYKKINSFSLIPTVGVASDKVDPGSNAAFTAEIQDFNLTAADRGCTWVLEYNTPEMGTRYEVCNNASIASGRVAGTSYIIQFGSKINHTYKFKLTATSNWDTTWSAEYEFGVTEPASVPGVSAASRGVEMDITELFTTGDYDWIGAKKSWFICHTCNGIPMDYTVDLIYDGRIDNNSGQDAEKMFQIIKRDGRLYIYVDYDAIRYVEDDGLLAIYDGNNSNIQAHFWWVCSNGHDEFSDAVNFSMPAISMSPASPVRGSTILLSKGGYQDISFTTVGYNLSKKNQIGIYIDGTNVNSTEVGYENNNTYLSASYVSGLGSRYVLCLSGIARITANTNSDDYPREGIPIKITLESFYKLVQAYKKGDKGYEDRSSYDLTAYIANVEGMDLFVQGPASMSGAYNSTTIAYYTNADAGSANVTVADKTTVPVKLGEEITLDNGYKITIDAVRTTDGSNRISSYVMTVNINGNKTSYYYNTTYRYWRAQS
ncbi:MAG: prepilin-type N-terminal cleavage/methylation domain-containing protein [Lachnospiraceae bacterium]|nr:prepilin-type N-terminal cleavage/methylation domain-containing protein [Lachnospiraceae bacterium]